MNQMNNSNGKIIQVISSMIVNHKNHLLDRTKIQIKMIKLFLQ
jgi:hypothetical protein